MATPVPYSGAPQVAPTDQPVPYRQLSVPGGAFGLGQAEATQQLGGAFKEAGGEIYARAVAMQELNEQAKVNEADANAQQEQMQGYLEFTQKRGADAGPEAYKEFMGNMNATREKYRSGLTSPYAQRLYDNQTRNATNRIIFSGGVHAKDQLRQYSQGALQSQMETAQRNVGLNPGDDTAFKAGMDSVVVAAQKFATGEGYSPEKTALYIDKQKEIYASSRIEGLVKSESPTAGKLLDQYSKAGFIGPQEAARLKDKVDAALINQDSRKTASVIMGGGGGSFGKGKVDLDLAVEGLASVESTNKWIGYHPPVPEGMKHAGARAMGRYGIMDFNLHSWLADAHMPDMTEQEFIDNHPAQTQLAKFKYNELRERLGSDNAAAAAWLGTGPSDGRTSQAQYNARFNAYLAGHTTDAHREQVSRDIAQERSPDNPLYADTLAHRVLTLDADHKRMDLADQQAARQTVDSAFEPGEDGKLLTNKDQLMAVPGMESAWNKLKPSERLGLEARLAANAKNGGYALTPESQKKYDHYMGLALSEDLTPDEKQELLDFSPSADKIPWNMVGKIRQAQQAISKGMTVDPHIGHAMDLLKDTLQEAGISDKRSDKEGYADYLKFKSSLHDVMQNYALREKGQMKDEDILAAGSRLIQSMPTGKQSFHLWGWGPHWENDQSKLYQIPVPEDVSKIIVQKYQARHNGIAPTPAKIQSIYTANKFQEQVDKSADKRFWQMPND